MPSPTNKKQAQSFIGMINYLSKFLPRLSELAEPIRELSKDRIPFNWGSEHQEAFQQMKREISFAPMLAHYNPQEANCVTDKCKYKRSWCLFTSRREACLFCK